MACPDENTFVDLLERRLDEDAARALESHVDACRTCASVVAALARETWSHGSPSEDRDGESGWAAWLPAGSTLGRYVLLHSLGSGGMGVVHAAYDPLLDRKVALKLLRGESGDLLREAQAMARLSHPNVLAVHDVGTLEGQVFLAMEYVDGCTLEAWLGAPRTSAEILGVFRKAGEGLAAAHAAGLVHRDFKPRNVLVGPGDRVRVTDFGLAARSDVRDESEGGTPAYMAPEQRDGGGDARADQFSFCKSLGDALKSASVPATRGVLGAIARGLEEHPEKRFPSMDALLRAFGRDAASTRRRVAAAVVFGAVPLAAVAIMALDGSNPCTGAERRLAGVWDAERKTAIQRAFQATDTPFAMAAWASVQAALDEHSSRWTDAHREACEATHVYHEQSDEMLDARMGCLSRRLGELRAVSDLFASADAAIVRNAAQAAQSIRGAETCADANRLTATDGQEDGPTRTQREAVEALLARVNARKDAGKFMDARAEAERAVVAARALGRRALEAEALTLLGDLQAQSGDPKKGEVTLLEGLWAAEAAGDRIAAAEATTGLVYVVGYSLGRNEEGWRWARHSEALLENAGGDDRVRGRLLTNMGSLHFARGEYPEARSYAAASLASYEKAFGPAHPRVTAALHNLGVAHALLGERREALDRYRQALAANETRGGPMHPKVASTLSSIANVLVEEGRQGEAIPHLRRALTIMKASYGDEHPDVALVRINLGDALHAAGEHAAALAEYERALEIDEKALGAEHPEVATIHVGMAHAHLALGRHEAAAAHFRRSRAIWEKIPGTRGGEHAELGGVLHGLGQLALARGRADEAIAHHRAALRIWEAALGAGHPRLALAWLGIAESELTKGRFDASLAAAAHAAEIRGKIPSRDPVLVSSWIALGRAHAGRGDRAKALDWLDRAAASPVIEGNPAEAARVRRLIAQIRR